MKRLKETTIAILAAALLMTGCSTAKVEAPSADDKAGTGTVEEGSVMEEQKEEPLAEPKEEPKEKPEEGDKEGPKEEPKEEPYNDPKSLPEYSYQGSDPYLGVISDHLIAQAKEELGEGDANVYIPFSMVVEVDDKDPADIIAYGIYNIEGFDLINTTLEGTSGSWSAGAFHLKTNEDGTFTVTEADLPLVSEESIEVFAPVPGLYEKVTELMDSESEKMREEAIAEYVSLNKLNITQWQSYGHAPVQVKGAKETPEDAQFYTYNSPFGYQLTYDLRELSLLASSGDDMYGRVEEEYTGTLMLIKKAEASDADTALTDAMPADDPGSIKFEDAEMIGAGIPCRRAEYDEVLEDGRIFRYVGYAVNTDSGLLTIIIETTVEKGVSEMTVEELEQYFTPTLATFTI